jgi:ribosome-associated protein
MRGRDQDSGEFLAPSRKQQRRDALDVLALAQALGEMSPAQLDKVGVPEHLLPHFAELRRITAHGARKRQHAYVAKQLRNEDDATLEAIRDAMDAGGESARQETALLHRVEHWRERLLEEGDAALAELLDAHPDADRQQLRQLVRNALDERARNKPPRAFRELFRVVREAIAEGSIAADGDGIA